MRSRNSLNAKCIAALSYIALYGQVNNWNLLGFLGKIRKSRKLCDVTKAFTSHDIVSCSSDVSVLQERKGKRGNRERVCISALVCVCKIGADGRRMHIAYLCV